MNKKKKRVSGSNSPRNFFKDSNNLLGSSISYPFNCSFSIEQRGSFSANALPIVQKVLGSVADGGLNTLVSIGEYGTSALARKLRLLPSNSAKVSVPNSKLKVNIVPNRTKNVSASHTLVEPPSIIRSEPTRHFLVETPVNFSPPKSSPNLANSSFVLGSLIYILGGIGVGAIVSLMVKGLQAYSAEFQEDKKEKATMAEKARAIILKNLEDQKIPSEKKNIP